MASADRNSPDRTDLELDTLSEWARADERDTSPATEIDPTVAETMRRLRALDATNELDQKVVARIWDELMTQSSRSQGFERNQGGVALQSLNGRHQPESLAAPVALSVPQERDLHRTWVGIQIAAALLIIALGIGYISFRSFRSDGNHRKTIPAAVSQPTPTPSGVSEELLVEFTIPADQIPHTNIGMGITRNTIRPGNRSTWKPYCCPGPMLEYVLEGSYTVRAEAEIQVVRAGGLRETVPPGMEVTLEAGDYLLSRNETVVESANTGTEMVQLLNWTLVEATGFSGHLLSGWSNNNPDVLGVTILPESPATVTLRLFELSPGVSIPAPPDGVFRCRITLPNNAAGTPVVSAQKGSDETIINNSKHEVTLYVLELITQEPVGTPVPGGAAP